VKTAVRPRASGAFPARPYNKARHMQIEARIISILGSASGSGHYYVGRLQRDVKVTRAVIDAALRDMERRGGVEFTGPTKRYVRATGRWFTEAA